jgi:ribosomal protein L11 methyltransferase
MRWAEMTIECPRDSVDAVTEAFFEAGCGGVTQIGTDPVSISGSLPVTDELVGRMTALKAHLVRLPEWGLPAVPAELTVRYAEEEDWANAWKQHFKPVRVGKSLIVKPSWEPYTPDAGDLVLELDPGMAFGTGNHPTTRLCMEALEKYINPGIRVADVGTGSGILSLAAARLGAANVFATDIELLPRQIAAENVVRNGLEGVISVLEAEDFEAAAQHCDLVVMNIVAHAIVALAPQTANRLKPDGIFIGSGIVTEHEAAVNEAMAAVGIDLVETFREDIWVCFVARKTQANHFDEARWHNARTLLPRRTIEDWAS